MALKNYVDVALAERTWAQVLTEIEHLGQHLEPDVIRVEYDAQRRPKLIVFAQEVG